MSPDFVHLHTHSSYSPMWGTSTLEALCEAVRSQGHDTFALTDTNGLYGAIRFLEVAKRAGLKPILGTEIIHAQHRAVLDLDRLARKQRQKLRRCPFLGHLPVSPVNAR